MLLELLSQSVHKDSLNFLNTLVCAQCLPIKYSKSLPNISWHSGGLLKNSFITADRSCNLTSNEDSSSTLLTISSSKYGLSLSDCKEYIYIGK